MKYIHHIRGSIRRASHSTDMAAPLYARYIPPKPKSAKTRPTKQSSGFALPPPATVGSKKRKRGIIEDIVHTAAEGNEVGVEESDSILRTKYDRRDGAVPLPEPADSSHDTKRSSSADDLVGGSDTLETNISTASETTRKHSSIFSKYTKAITNSRKTTIASDDPTPEKAPQEIHDLVPIPIPSSKQETRGFALTAGSALPSWLSSPVTIRKDAAGSFENLHLTTRSVARLHKMGHRHALPLQTGILPLLLPTSTQHPGDLCVSAATGSGKTLAYILPVVESLRMRQSNNLRAVIVVPTRELVKQVRDTMEHFTSGTGLSVATAMGAQQLPEEQISLVSQSLSFELKAFLGPARYVGRSKLRHMALLETEEEMQASNLCQTPLSSVLPHHMHQYESKSDILICTPGRLVDHIHHTIGFSLAHLEWLIIDEADRLLDASFQEWVDIVSAALDRATASTPKNWLEKTILSAEPRGPRKIFLSATIMHDLEKLAGLNLFNPRLILLDGVDQKGLVTDANNSAQRRLNLPTTLHEHGVPIDNDSEKPLFLVNLVDGILGDVLNTQGQNIRTHISPSSGATTGLDRIGFPDSTNESVGNGFSSSEFHQVAQPSLQIPSANARQAGDEIGHNVLIFASTNESTHRLANLLVHIRPAYKRMLSTITKSNTSRTTARAISFFRNGRCRIIIATDRASRGLDFPNLSHVINYDVPHSLSSYVHRVGRTARAGKWGNAWTLVEPREARWFWNEVAKGNGIFRGDNTVRRVHVSTSNIGMRERQAYADALRSLKVEVRGAGRI